MKTNESYCGFTPCSREELAMVSGGGIFNWLKSAAKWAKDNIYVDVKNRVVGVKGKF